LRSRRDQESEALAALQRIAFPANCQWNRGSNSHQES
jgi:hypothetical protein